MGDGGNKGGRGEGFADSVREAVADALVGGLNRACRSVLALDADGARNFARLRGKVFCIEVREPQVTLYLVPSEEGFAFCREAGLAEGAAADVTLSGSLLAFARLGGRLRGGAGSAEMMRDGEFAGGGVTIHGDAELGQMLQRIFARLDLDGEEWLVRNLGLGDEAAHQVAGAVRRVVGWAGDSVGLARENAGDFFAEEAGVLLSETARKRQEDAIHRVRADLERLGARVEKLVAASMAGKVGG